MTEIKKLKEDLPRKEVMLFAEGMERKLKKNDYKGGWKDCSYDFLYNKLQEEIKELQTAWDNCSNRMLYEAVDVANILMMMSGVWKKI